MKFLREDREVAEQAIAEAICDGLFASKRVLWLTSGGSNVAVEKLVMDKVRAHGGDKLTGLAILPMDERYGKPGHAESNTQQLRVAGFDPGEAIWADILQRDMPFDQTVSLYNDITAAALANADVVVGQFGLGADGHVAGIKPGSPATELDESTVAGYEWDDYIRMTLMPSALKQVTKAFLVAYGADKRTPLAELQKHSATFKVLPAMLLYELPGVRVYNDQIGSEDLS